MLRPACFWTVLLLVLFVPVVSQEPNTKHSDVAAAFDADEVSEVIEQTLLCHAKPAVAVAVVRDGQVLLSKGFGKFGLDNKKQVTNSSVFGIASVSKLFSATLLVKLLYEKTNLTVDSPIRLLLGKSFNMADPVRTAQATFTDLLAHKMGIPDYNRLRFDPNLTREALLDRLQFLQTNDQFRVKYYYSNIMYGLVSRISELIGGKTWEELVDEHLFKPLGMKSSTFASVANFDREDMVTPYAFSDDQMVPVHPEFSRRWAQLSGSGSVMTSADDMVHWMNFHLFGGKNSQGNQVVKAEHIAEVYKGRFFVGPERGKETRLSKFPVTCTDEIYAFGIRRGFYRGYERLVHTGSTMGYRAYMALLPEPKIGVFIAMTGMDDGYIYRHPLHMYLLDRALGVQSWLNSSTICTYPEPWEKRSAVSPPKLNPNVTLQYDSGQYEGLYHNEIFGYVTVTYNKTYQALVLTYGWGQWRLYSISIGTAETFYAKGLGINNVFDITPVYFVSEDNKTIVAIKATGFMGTIPPTFLKINNDKDVVKNGVGALVHFNTCIFITLTVLNVHFL